MFRSSPEDTRKALGTLLGENRLRVRPDPEQGFSVSGDALLCAGSMDAWRLVDTALWRVQQRPGLS